MRVMAFEPAFTSGKIALIRIRISENAMVDPCLQIIDHFLRHPEIHVRDPER